VVLANQLMVRCYLARQRFDPLEPSAATLTTTYWTISTIVLMLIASFFAACLFAVWAVIDRWVHDLTMSHFNDSPHVPLGG